MYVCIHVLNSEVTITIATALLSVQETGKGHVLFRPVPRESSPPPLPLASPFGVSLPHLPPAGSGLLPLPPRSWGLLGPLQVSASVADVPFVLCGCCVDVGLVLLGLLVLLAVVCVCERAGNL